MESTSPLRSVSNPSTSVACLNCREKHLKCDGNSDGCRRCKALKLFCHFVPSRRGRRGQPSNFLALYEGYAPIMEDPCPIDVAAMPPLISEEASSVHISSPWQPSSQENMQLSKIFYEYFHPAHPILPPFEFWAISSPPSYLVSIVQFIGLHYLWPGQMSDSPADLRAATGDAELSLEKVQAYLFLSILLHGRKDPAGAKECIALSIECGFALGLNCKEVSDTMKMQNPVRAESMRRTWWEMFIVDTLLATLQVGGTLQFNIATSDVSLPSDDDQYLPGHSGISSITLEDLSHRSLFSDDRLSSHAYRIEAALILRRCLIACEEHACEESLGALDATISTFFHRWPIDRNTILQPTGKVNQIDFQTAMIMQCASVYLHFPKSFFLLVLPVTSDIFCSRPPSFSSPSLHHQKHTAKITSAAVELSSLASLTTSVTTHSPFFACALVLSSIIQLTVFNVPTKQSVADYHPHLALNISVLKSMGRIWINAACSVENLREIAAEVEASLMKLPQELLGNISSPSTVPV